MTAFGPFRDTVSVDFAALGRNPLFLICGPTGAGKTTLLDAMCFALFGVPSGGAGGAVARKEKDLRCQSAEPRQETEVRFVFEIGAKRYLAERKPQQETAAKRRTASGMTTRRAQALFAELNADDSLVESSRVTDLRLIDDAVTRALGLDADQFRQVVMLPQGEFRQFLVAPHEPRQKILSALFQAERYGHIVTAFKARRQAANAAADEAAQFLQGKLSSAGVTEAAQIADLLENAQTLREAAATRLRAAEAEQHQIDVEHTAATQLEALFRTRDAAERDWQEVQARRPAHEADQRRLQAAQRARAVAGAAEVAATARQRVERLKSQRATSAAEFDAADLQQRTARETLKRAEDDAARKSPALRSTVERLEAAMPRFQTLRESEAALQQATLAQAEAAEGADRARRALTVSTARAATLAAEMQVLAKSVARRSSVESQLEAARSHAVREQLIADVTKKLRELQALAETYASEVAAAEGALRTAECAYEQAVAWEIRAQASKLAAALVPGEPCPVCGSAEHPVPAHGSTTRAEPLMDLEESRLAVSRARERWEVAGRQRSACATSIAALEGQRAGATQQGRPPGEPLDVDALSVTLTTIGRDEETLRHHQQEQAALAASLPTLQASLDTAAQAAQKAATGLEVASAARDQAARELPPGHGDIASAQAARESASTELTRLVEAVTMARATSDTATSRRAALEGSVRVLSGQIAEAEPDAEVAHARFDTALSAHGFAGARDYEAARLSDAHISELEKTVRSTSEELARAEKAWVDSQEACGELARPDLESIVERKRSALLRIQVASAEIGTQDNALGALKRLSDECIRLESELARLNDTRARLDTLTKAVAGTNARQLALETYYLTSLFDQVVAAASERLARMTDGRYRLHRVDEAESGRERAGLDLAVSDAYSDGMRAVRTLSGGESFLASLALALGLSDAVLAQSGARTLDALFIDEGFGALDPDTLDVAMATLQELRGSEERGRAVGIISHVEDVKRAIAKRIVVGRRRGDAVSTIEVIA
jgi:exonuclease SbcC